MTKEIPIPDSEDPSSYCLFCGKHLKTGYDDYAPYHYCDCPDVLHNEKIKEEISKLKDQLRPAKYKAVQKVFLVQTKESTG